MLLACYITCYKKKNKYTNISFYPIKIDTIIIYQYRKRYIPTKCYGEDPYSQIYVSLSAMWNQFLQLNSTPQVRKNPWTIDHDHIYPTHILRVLPSYLDLSLYMYYCPFRFYMKLFLQCHCQINEVSFSFLLLFFFNFFLLELI